MRPRRLLEEAWKKGKCSPAGVDVAAADWSHDIPSVRDFMKRTCVAYFSAIPEFAEFILQ